MINHSLVKTYIEKLAMFSAVSKSDIDTIYNSSELITYKKDTIIINEGDFADSLYIILTGSVQVFTLDKEGKRVVLARIEAGCHFGEQGYLNNYIRTASLITLTDVECVKIKYQSIDPIFKKYNKVQSYLEKSSIEQSLKNLQTQIKNIDADVIKLFRKKSFFDKSENIITQHYHADDVIFKKGDISDYVYFISSGLVEIILDTGDQKEAILIKKNHMFGELGVMQNQNRSATALAKKNTTLIAITAKNFIAAVNQSSNLKSLVLAYKKSYSLPHNKGIVEQYTGNFNTNDAIITKYLLRNGMTVMCAKVINQPIFTMRINDLLPDETLTFSRGDLIHRTISLRDNKIISIDSFGDWDELNILCELLLDTVSLKNVPKTEFEKTGNLLSLSSESKVHLDEMICNCMSVSCKVIKEKIAQGCHELDEISAKTGACTACGGCRNKILDLLGQSKWKSSTINADISYSDMIKSFIIKPVYDQLPSFTPGQHVSIKLQMNGLWIERSYTLTSLSSPDHYQIIVKKYDKGIFGPWLFENAKNPLFIWISPPAGNFTLPIQYQGSFLFFAGGIGITPFIAYIRSMKESKNKMDFHLYYFVRRKSDVAIPADIKEYIADHLKVIDDETNGILTGQKIQSIIDDIKPAYIYICGPELFESTISKKLQELQFDNTHIRVERFLPSG